MLNAVFGRLQFVHLWRDDVVAQAASWLRAEQTGFWHHEDGVGSGDTPWYDEARMHEFVRMIERHNAAWRSWFVAAGVVVHSVRYEDLVMDLDSVTRDFLDFLGVRAPDGHQIVAGHRRQGDQINADWIERYRSARQGNQAE